MSEANRPWQGRTEGGDFGLRFLLWFLKYVNLHVGYFFVATSIPFYLIFRRKARNEIYHFFRYKMGFSTWDAAKSTIKQHYRFGQVLMDKLTVLARGKADFKVFIDGEELFNQLIDGDEGFVITGAHVGNFELAGYLLKQDKKKIYSVIFGGEEPILQQYRLKQFEHSNGIMIPIQEDMSHLFQINAALDRGDIVSMPADRHFGSDKSAVCPFFGANAKFPVGAFQLAAAKNVPTILLLVVKESIKQYRIFVRRLDVQPCAGENKKQLAQRIACRYAQELEHIVRQYPEQWFNFYDFWNLS